MEIGGEKMELASGEFRGPRPPDGKHLWVVYLAAEVEEEKLRSAYEAAGDDGDVVVPEMKIRNDQVRMVSPPRCFLCDEDFGSAYLTPCVGHPIGH